MRALWPINPCAERVSRARAHTHAHTRTLAHTCSHTHHHARAHAHMHTHARGTHAHTNTHACAHAQLPSFLPLVYRPTACASCMLYGVRHMLNADKAAAPYRRARRFSAVRPELEAMLLAQRKKLNVAGKSVGHDDFYKVRARERARGAAPLYAQHCHICTGTGPRLRVGWRACTRAMPRRAHSGSGSGALRGGARPSAQPARVCAQGRGVRALARSHLARSRPLPRAPIESAVGAPAGVVCHPTPCATYIRHAACNHAGCNQRTPCNEPAYEATAGAPAMPAAPIQRRTPSPAAPADLRSLRPSVCRPREGGSLPVRHHPRCPVSDSFVGGTYGLCILP